MSETLSELKTMETICAALQSLEPNARNRAMQWLLGALGVPDGQLASSVSSSEHPNPNGGASQSTQSTPNTQTVQNDQNGTSTPEYTPKEFVNRKQPQAVVERLACLAFYLTHYRGTSTFGGTEIEALNTEAACSSINRSRDMDNVSRAGYLVPANNGKKQISSRGEELVKALPDREAVKAVQAKYPSQRRRRSGNSKKRGTNGDAE